jgi:Ankyrin repeat
MARRYMKVLKEEGYDFEQKDIFGMTPLLDHLAAIDGENLAIVRLLLQFGANIHATDIAGRNALQITMGCNIWRSYRRDLEPRLCLLIKAGADIYHCDKYGSNPFDYARAIGCWSEWVKALESNGLNIFEVTIISMQGSQGIGEQRRQESGSWAIAENTAEETDEDGRPDETRHTSTRITVAYRVNQALHYQFG